MCGGGEFPGTRLYSATLDESLLSYVRLLLLC